jgi:hypothetical protein
MYRTFLTPIFAALLISLFLYACSGDGPTGGQQLAPTIYGRVVDTNGQPVAGAAIGLRFSITNSSDTSGTGAGLYIYPNPAALSSEFGVQVSSAQHIFLKLLRWDTGTLALTVLDATLNAGQHTSAIDLSSQPNQLYTVRYEREQDTSTRFLLLNNLESFQAVVRTDVDGRFVIHYSSLPIGIPFHRTYENRQSAGWQTIDASLGISIDNGAGKTMIWSLKIDTTAVIDSTLQLE